MTDAEKKQKLSREISLLVADTCIKLEIFPYDAIEVMVKNIMILAISSAKEGREADVVLDVISMVKDFGTDMIERKRGEGDYESSVQRSH